MYFITSINNKTKTNQTKQKSLFTGYYECPTNPFKDQYIIIFTVHISTTFKSTFRDVSVQVIYI